MDNKYQDLYVYDKNEQPTLILRMLEITQIKFTETDIQINFIKDRTPMSLLIPKKNNSFTID